MSAFEEQPTILDTEKIPTAEVFTERGTQEKVDFSQLQNKGESLLKTVLPNGEMLMNKLEIADNEEAQEASKTYNARIENIREEIKKIDSYCYGRSIDTECKSRRGIKNRE